MGVSKLLHCCCPEGSAPDPKIPRVMCCLPRWLAPGLAFPLQDLVVGRVQALLWEATLLWYPQTGGVEAQWRAGQR